MDIQRPASVARQKKMRRILFGAIGVIIIGVVSVVLNGLKPAAPTVERATVWVDTVKRGSMLRQVRGLGTLVPVDEARRLIPAATQGRVERILIRPGVEVTPDTVVLELSDPQLQQQLSDAEQQLRGAQADLNSLQARLQNDRLTQRSQAAVVEADYRAAVMQKEVDENLAKDGLVSSLVQKQSALRAESLAQRDKIAKDSVAVAEQ